jgi:hypothetical protein
MKVLDKLRKLATWGLPLLTLCAQPAAADGAEFEGRWEGAILMTPGRHEVDFEVELRHDADGEWAGDLSLTILGLLDRPLEDVTVTGSSLSFVAVEDDEVSAFRGDLTDHGVAIEGELYEGGRKYPFRLERRAGDEPEPPAPQLHLLADADQLKAAFNRDRGKVRFLQFYSPKCEICRMSARMVERHVLDEVGSDELRGYLVWQPVFQYYDPEAEQEDRRSAEQATALVTDPRVTHFWTESTVIAESFRGVLGIEEDPVWNVILVFSRDATWGDDAPRPETFMYRMLKGLPDNKQFNAYTLADTIRGQLAKAYGGAEVAAGDASR